MVPIALLVGVGAFFGSIQLIAASQILIYSSLLIAAISAPLTLFVLSNFALWIVISVTGSWFLTWIGVGSLGIFNWGNIVYEWLINSLYTPA